MRPLTHRWKVYKDKVAARCVRCGLTAGVVKMEFGTFEESEPDQVRCGNTYWDLPSSYQGARDAQDMWRILSLVEHQHDYGQPRVPSCEEYLKECVIRDVMES